MNRSLRDPWSSVEEERDSLATVRGFNAQRLALGNSLLGLAARLKGQCGCVQSPKPAGSKADVGSLFYLSSKLMTDRTRRSPDFRFCRLGHRVRNE